jgi:uncharacterized protein YodC (DUF2158 family)
MFQADDVVVLKAGSQTMIVHGCGDLNGTPHAWCKWLDTNGFERSKAYPESVLTLSKPD